MTVKKNKKAYLNNSKIKAAGVLEEMTPENVREYHKCMKDPVYFAKNYIKIINLDEGLVNFNMYPYQEEMFKHFQDNRFSIVLACRQSGKSISVCAYLLWYVIFNSEQTVALLANKAQTARELFARIVLMLEQLPFWLQPGVKGLNKSTLECENNSRIVAASTSASSIRGMSCNLIALEEFAFVQDSETFYTSTYPVISSGKSSKVIIISTAYGVGNMFYKLWEGANEGNNEYKPFRVDWYDVPGRDEEWKKTQIANTSQSKFDQEFGNCLGHDSIITIQEDNQITDIKIGDLYNSLPLFDRKILTPTGFQKFDGVKRYWHDKYMKFIFEDNSSIDTAFDHRFIVNGEERFAKNIQPGNNIGKKIRSVGTIYKGDWFYDPVNVANGQIYNHDDKFVSHNTFIGTGNTLIDADTLLKLKASMPRNVLEAYCLKIFKEPEKNHSYVMTVDTSQGLGQDYSTFTIIDITNNPFDQVATYRNNKMSPNLFPAIIYKYANLYNEAVVVAESNNQGAMVCEGLYNDLGYENTYTESSVRPDKIGVMMTKKTKRIGCSNFKDLLENDRLKINDEESIAECISFVVHGDSYKASEGNHDDLIMNLVLFGFFTSTTYFIELTDIAVKQMVFAERMKQIEDDVPPFGFIDDGSDYNQELENRDMINDIMGDRENDWKFF